MSNNPDYNEHDNQPISHVHMRTFDSVVVSEMAMIYIQLGWICCEQN